MTSQFQLASIMAPGNQAYWWYYSQTGAQIGQLLTQNKAMLTKINAYIDTDDTVKFAVVMEPATKQWWWYAGVTAEQVSQYLTQNKAQLTHISAYIDTSGALKFAVIMAPPTGTGWWWYVGIDAVQVTQYLTQNKAQLTHISAYIDTSGALKFAVIMAPPTGTGWWWYYDQTVDQLTQHLAQTKAQLTDLSAYVDIDNTLKFAAIMAPPTGTGWSWYYGSPAYIGQQLTQHKSSITALSPYLRSTSNSLTVHDNPNISGLNGTADLTMEATGAYTFSGGWSPSNVFTGLVAQDVSYTIGVRDSVRGKLFVFSDAGTLPIEGNRTFNYTGTNPSITAEWQFLSVGYTWHANYSAYLDFSATVGAVTQWFNDNKQTISEVVAVVGAVGSAL